MAKVKSSAFDVKDSHFRKGRWKDRDEFTVWLCNELDIALSARSGVASEIKLAWDYYESARMRGSNAPWPDAADLPSPYAPEYTDAVHARLMQTIFVEPVWTVEGWGASAQHAPFVEEFHQRAQEDERLQGFADEWVLRGLIEGVGTLEVSEAFETRRERVKKRVALQLDEATGAPILGEDDKPLLASDENGEFIEAQTPEQPSAEAELDVLEPVRLGPDYDVIPYLDFLVLPAHSRNRKQVWGYAKRFWRRVPELEGLVRRGVYDKDAIDGIGTDNDRATLSDEAPQGAVVVSQDGPTAQKELFEVQLLADCDGQGERWYRVTVHKDRRKLLRMKHDDRSTRYIRWMPFPKPGSMDRGYSLIGNKLISVLEEDTARRNMTADHMAMLVGQPVKRLQGALWDPYEQPWSPRAVIDVRDMREVEAFQGITNHTPTLFNWGQNTRADADRLIGQNDVAQGQISEEKRTLGEVQLVAGYAEVRINVISKRLAEPMEELFQARHTIWKNTLATNPKLPPQRALVIGTSATGIDTTGVSQDQQITAEMLEGIFWGKPRGSVETADKNRQRANFNNFLQTIPALAQLSPAIGMIFQTPVAAKALIGQALYLNNVEDKQSFVGSEAQNVFDVMQQQQELQQDPRMQLLMGIAGASPGGAQPMGAEPPAEEGAVPPTKGMVQ